MSKSSTDGVRLFYTGDANRNFRRLGWVGPDRREVEVTKEEAASFMRTGLFSKAAPTAEATIDGDAVAKEE